MGKVGRAREGDKQIGCYAVCEKKGEEIRTVNNKRNIENNRKEDENRE